MRQMCERKIAGHPDTIDPNHRVEIPDKPVILYTETQLTRRINRDWKLAPKLREAQPSRELLSILHDTYLNGLLDAAELTPRQEMCFKMYAAGFTYTEIAETFQVFRREVAQHIRTAKQKLRGAYKRDLYAGWYEVYLSEINRPIRGKR